MDVYLRSTNCPASAFLSLQLCLLLLPLLLHLLLLPR